MFAPQRSYKTLLWILTFAVGLVLLFGLFQFFKYHPQAITRRFQSAFTAQESQVQDSLTHWKQRESTAVWTDPNRSSTTDKLWTVLWYHQDQLAAWSASEMEAPARWDPSDTNAFYQTTSASYYRFFAQHDSVKWIVALNLQHWNPLRPEAERQALTPLLRSNHQFKIDSTSSEFAIVNRLGQPCFYLHFTDSIALTREAQVLLFTLLFFVFFVLLMLGYQRCRSLVWFVCWALGCRLLMAGVMYVQSLGEVNFLEITSTPYFSSRIPYINTSLGSICLNLLLAAVMMLFASRSGTLNQWMQGSRYRMVTWSKKIGLTVLLIALSAEMIWVLRSVITELPMPIDMKFVFNVDILFGLVLFAIALMELLFVILVSVWIKIWAPKIHPTSNNLMRLLWTMVLLTGGVALLFNRFLDTRERAERINYASEMVHSRLLAAEDRFAQLADEICEDTTLQQSASTLEDEKLLTYLKDRHFTRGWEIYDMEMTICKPQTQLLIETDTMSCRTYFEKTIQRYGCEIKIKTAHQQLIKLYHLHYAPDYSTYIGRILLDSLQNKVLYVEFMKNSAVSYLNIEALSDNRWRLLSRLTSDYGYAYYHQGDLLKSVGLYNYPLRWNNPTSKYPEIEWFQDGVYSHLVYPMDKGHVLVLSARDHTFWSQASTFAVLVLFNMIWVFVLYFLIHLPPRRLWNSFANRLQILTLWIVFGSFAVIGSLTILYIQQQNRQKNSDFLREKAYSTLLDLEYNYADDTVLNNDAKLKELVDDMSAVLLANMNVYDPSGFLLYTTQPLLLESHLMPNRIHSSAYHAMVHDHQNFYIQRETIANSRYHAMYVPLRNRQAQILGYINLPMYSRELELRREISRFLTSFVSIYVWFLLIVMAIVSWLTRRMSQPLRDIAERMRTIDIHQENRKLPIHRSDEIGMLVNEYNRMVEELEQGTARLIQSERQGAWTEMARQIAHEIKNPLTPMKLSVQQIERAWKDQAPDYPKRMERFVRLMIEQIEQLSETANEFSNFALISQPKPEPVRIDDIIRQVLDLFASNTLVHQDYHSSLLPLQTVVCDPVILRRVLINILKNAYQAIENVEKPCVNIRVTSLERDASHWCRIDLSNNGPEIPEALTESIFEPNFTTKTAGMGLGLAISRKSIEALDGHLTLICSEARKVCFRVELPFVPSRESGKS